MKRKLFLWLLFIPGILEAQMDWKNDPVFSGWSQIIPQEWTISGNAKQVIIEGKDPVYILDENKINAPVLRETPKQTQDRIQTYGKLQKPRLVFELSPRNLVPGKLLSKYFSVTCTQILGVNDDFHTLAQDGTSERVFQLKTALEKTLFLVIDSLKALDESQGRPVCLSVKKSRTISQHVVDFPSGFKHSEYVEIGGEETVMYSKEPIRGSGPWVVHGRALILEADSKDPRRKERYREVHLVAESIE